MSAGLAEPTIDGAGGAAGGEPAAPPKVASTPTPSAPSQLAVTVATLAVTPESALAVFRKRRAPDSSLEVEDLVRARAVLGAMCATVAAPNPLAQELVGKLWDALESVRKAHPEAADSLSPPAPPPPRKPAPAARITPAGPGAKSDGSGEAAPAVASSHAAPPEATDPTSVRAPELAGEPQLAGPPPIVGAPPPGGGAPPAAAAAAPPASARVPAYSPPASIQTPGPSPWASGSPAPSPGPSAPLPPPPPSPPPPSHRGIDFAALQRIKLSEGSPGTMDIADAVMLAPALPFREGDGTPPSSRAAAGEATPFRPHAEPTADASGMTMSGEVLTPVRGVTLPFQKGKDLRAALASAPSAPPAAVVPAPDAPAPPPAAPASEPGRRAPPASARVATPFAPTSAPSSPGERDAQEAAEVKRPATPFRTLLQRAVASPAAAAPPPAGPPPPPPAAPSPAAAPAAEPAPRAEPPRRPAGPPELSVEQCAALFAECVTLPDRRAQVWTRFGIDGEPGYRAVEQVWREKFARDAQLFQRWNALYQHYCRWFGTQRGAPGGR